MSRDESLADLETDKVVLEVPAPAAGILKEIHSPAGSVVKSGDLLAVLEAGASAEARALRAPTPAARARCQTERRNPPRGRPEARSCRATRGR